MSILTSSQLRLLGIFSFFTLMNFLFAGEKPVQFQFLTRVQVAGVYNDNLIIGTESRTPLPALADRYMTYTVDLGLGIALPFNQNLTVQYGYYKEDEQQVTFLRRVDQSFAVAWQGNIGGFLYYNLKADYRSYDFTELSDLDFNQLSVKLFSLWQFRNGARLHLDVSRQEKRFVQSSDNVTGYSLVNARETRVNLRLQKWVWRDWRLSVRVLGGAIEYDPTRSIFLNNLSGLLPTQARRDIRWVVQPEVGKLLWRDALLVTIGLQGEVNHSNTDYYDFWGIRGLTDVGWSVAKNHFVALETGYGMYRYPRRQFDSCYQNTKEDFRLSLALTYQWDITAYLTAEVKYQLLYNNSNDAMDYNPFTTLTYSTFQQNQIQVNVKVDMSRLIF